MASWSSTGNSDGGIARGTALFPTGSLSLQQPGKSRGRHELWVQAHAKVVSYHGSQVQGAHTNSKSFAEHARLNLPLAFFEASLSAFSASRRQPPSKSKRERQECGDISNK